MISFSYKKWAVAVIVCLLTILVYLPALKNDFVYWDDDLYVFENPDIRTLDLKALAWMFTTHRTANWHPLTWLSHSMDYVFWGDNPLGHHLTNIILHGLNALLVFLVVLQLLLRARASFVPAASYPVWAISCAGIAALLFGYHPLHVESVAWVAERKDLLCAFFYLLSISSYISYASLRSRGGGLAWIVISLLCALLALMSKPMAITLPLILLLIDVYPLGRLGREGVGRVSVLLEKIPFLAMSMMSALLTMRAQHAAKAIGGFDILPVQARVLNGIHALAFYLQKMVVPAGLSPLYPYPYPSTIRWSDLRYLISIIVIVLITAGCVWASKRGKHLWSAAWGYYVVTLLPVIGIVQVGMQAAADRYTYLPSISIFLLVGVGFAWAWNGDPTRRYVLFRKGAVLIVLCFAFLVFGMLTVKQIDVWRTSENLWKYVVAHAPVKVPLAYNNLGNALARAGKLEEAVSAYEQALAVKPDYADAINNLGIVYGRSGDVDGAIAQYKKVLTRAPDYYRAHYNLANAFSEKGLIEAAITEYEKALSINPGYERARRSLMDAYARKQSLDQKIGAYENTLAANIADATLHNTLGDLYLKKGMIGEAIDQFRQAIVLRPDYAIAYNYLAWIYATSFHDRYRNGREAVALAIRACELTEFKNAYFLDTLAAAFAEAGDFKSAVLYQEKTLAMSQEKEQSALRARLRRYQSGQAYRCY